ncbi:MAG: NAD-dependent epimerase/dehydratase family protein, partial [Myxococcota bacterium]
YSTTKAEAERLVLAADTPGGLRTVSLRPHLLWGPGDTNFIPRILSRSRSGQLVRLHAPKARIDCVYIDDAVRAHLLAAEALAERPEQVGGRAYFITSGQPVGTWHFVDRILEAAKLPPPARTIPVPVAYMAAWGVEWLHGLLGRSGEPQMTRWIVSEMATTRWFDIRAARRDLGYTPQVSLDEGMARLAAWLRTNNPGGAAGSS